LAPSKTLKLNLVSATENIKENHFRNLPPVNVLQLNMCQTGFRISDSTFLALVGKHRIVDIWSPEEGIQEIATFVKALEIVSQTGHRLEFCTSLSRLFEFLSSFGVNWDGENIISFDPSII
ncbi:hypothetical protein PMAYCL1PPCAC_05086, partial [Pristionchus mayeri]